MASKVSRRHVAEPRASSSWLLTCEKRGRGTGDLSGVVMVVVVGGYGCQDSRVLLCTSLERRTLCDTSRD